MLPRSLADDLRQQVLAARASWEQDRQAQHGGVEVPHALENKYPGVGQRWGWFWVFPASALSVGPRTGIWRRHHLYEERLQRALKKAVAQVGICNAGVNAHLAPQLRHVFVALGHRHPHGAGTAGAFGREHDDDLHPCPEGRCRSNLQPVGCLGLAAGWMAALGRLLSDANDDKVEALRSPTQMVERHQ